VSATVQGTVVLAVLALLGCGTRERASSPSPRLTTVAERIPFEVGAVLPMTPDLEVPGGGTLGVRARDCGACHEENYEEWRQSTHAHAMRDPQFFGELSKPDQPRWLCLNCHAPNQRQRRVVIAPDTQLLDDPLDVSGLVEVENPHFDPAMRDEGVTCATCHVRVEDGRSVVVGVEASGRAPHPVRARPDALRSVCLRCHDPGPGTITPTFTCWFETAREGRASGVQAACVDCHMPSVERPLVEGGPPRRTRHHAWTGGGVPKTYPSYDALLARGYRPGGVLEARRDGAAVTVTLSNANAGHHLPSADPERFLWVETEVELRSGERRRLDGRSFGQRWDWGSTDPPRQARRLEDTRIPAGESRRYTVPLPEEVVAIRVSAAHVRLTPENARYLRATPIPEEVRALWPDAPQAVEDLESTYPLMTWFARQTYRAETDAWTATSLDALLRESRDLRGRPLGDYPDFAAPP
jgi:nitrate reductase cytochrome c-type subunit